MFNDEQATHLLVSFPYVRDHNASKKILGVFLALACLLSCAEPPGLRQPLPPDPREEFAAYAAYRRAASDLGKEEGVLSTYLTRTNNPREVVVVVRDKDVRRRLDGKYRGRVNGLPVRVELAPKGFEEEAIQRVQQEMLPTTWWEKVVYYLRHYAFRWWPGARSEGNTPAPASSLTPT